MKIISLILIIFFISNTLLFTQNLNVNQDIVDFDLLSNSFAIANTENFACFDSIVVGSLEGNYSEKKIFTYNNRNKKNGMMKIENLYNQLDTTIMKYYYNKDEKLTKVVDDKYYRAYYYYDDLNRLDYRVDTTECCFFSWSYTYDSEGKLTQRYYSSYNGDGTYDRMPYSYYYDDNGNLIFAFCDFWNWNGIPTPWWYTYEYDENQNKIKFTSYSSDTEFHTDSTETRYFYNDLNQLVREIKYSRNNNELPEYKIDYSYIGNNLSEVLTSSYSLTDSVFIKEHLTQYRFNKDNNIVDIVDQDWDNGWIVTGTEFYNYNKLGNCISGGTSGRIYRTLRFIDNFGNRHNFSRSFTVFYKENTEQNNITAKLSLESPIDNSVIYLASSSFTEGQNYIINKITLEEPYADLQKEANVFEGTRFSLGEGAIDENIALDIRFKLVDLDNSVPLPFFMFWGIEVTGEQSGVTSFEDFYKFNDGKKARICIPQTKQFVELLAELEIDITEIDFAFLKGGEYITEGIKWEIKNGEEGKPDSVCIYIDHFSQIVGGKNLIISLEEEKNNLPTKFGLEQNYPNPFNPTTTISYTIPSSVITSGAKQSSQISPSGRNDNIVTLKIFDVLGKEVKTLVNKHQQAGNYEISFDASNLSSGIYYYQLRSGSFVETKKMILMK